MYRSYSSQSRSSGRSFSGGRILIALVMVGFSLISYFGSKAYNPVTQEDQYVSITPQQEIALGLQAAPEMIQEFGGLDANQEAQAFLDEVCEHLVENSDAQETEWPYECHLLADNQTINAFALPGGPLFITAALYNQFETEGQLAGVMAHEIGHVVARHSAQQMAQTQLTQGLTGAFVIAAYDPNNPNSQYSAQMAMLVGQLINMKFSRDDELQSDRLGVRFLGQAGYDPHALIVVMQILAEASEGGPPEFFSTHPNPENRIEQIEAAIAEEFPNGVPEGLQE
ncbi:MAG: M48 family metalloprotease [Chloroflexi bacterium]|nr:M48 family metalloprotease [Chloroflexota bacterium]MBP8058483.1 M48 family metalloprotease [Chloroflexota bacterium]